MKIGVFICHCGSNIAGTVDCGKVAEIAKTYPDVAFSTDTMYTCSEPGQEEIVAAIKEHKLDGVVVASCTPRMHEPTFRRTVERAGLNKYMFEMANIREHVSWIGKDKEANTINAEFCRKLTSGKCGVCAKVCPTGAINYEMKDEEVTETVGAIVAATGYDLMDWTVYGEYGAGQYPDVITSLQYERIMSASGPTGGHIKRPSDGKEPKSVVFIQCVGSRDKSIGRPYCSGFCCMYTAKQAVLTKDHIPDSQSYVFYMDIRSNAKLYDEFTRRAVEEYGTQYIRGRVSAIQPDGHGQYIVRGADTLLGKPVEVKADMVVLAVGIEGSKGANKLAETLHISYDGFGFFMESHCKLRPVETNTAGVFLAGVAQGPKDIPSSVAQGSGAAAKVIGLLSKPLLESDPQISVVDIKRCVGCGKCIKVCPFQAIVEKEIRGEKKAQTIEAVCQGCGLCTATCPQGAIQLSHFTDNQILAEVDALCRF